MINMKYSEKITFDHPLIEGRYAWFLEDCYNSVTLSQKPTVIWKTFCDCDKPTCKLCKLSCYAYNNIIPFINKSYEYDILIDNSLRALSEIELSDSYQEMWWSRTHEPNSYGYRQSPATTKRYYDMDELDDDYCEKILIRKFDLTKFIVKVKRRVAYVVLDNIPHMNNWRYVTGVAYPLVQKAVAPKTVDSD